MGKKYGECKQCKSNNFLNYAGLCKKCNRGSVGSEIKVAIAEMQQQKIEAQKEREKQKIEDLKEERALDETTVVDSDSEDDEKKENEEDPKKQK